MASLDRPNILFTPEDIQKAVRTIGHSVALWVRGHQAEHLHLVSVLEGAKPFTRDLTAALENEMPQLKTTLFEIRIKGTDGTKLLKERIPMSGFPQIKGKDPILLIDDLVDSGLTLLLLGKELVSLKAGPVKTAVLIRKFGEASGPVDFCGFDLGWSKKTLAQRGLKDCWLYGYGMDLNGHQRELRHIGQLEIK